MLQNLLARIPLNGNKTWLAGLGLIVYAIAGFVTGNLDFDHAAERLLEGLAIVGIGHKFEKAVGVVLDVLKIGSAANPAEPETPAALPPPPAGDAAASTD